MIYLQSGKYFYKKTNNGKMTRISKKVYMENIDKIKESSDGGGMLPPKKVIGKPHRRGSRVHPDSHKPLEEGMFSILIRVKDEEFIDSTKYYTFNKNLKNININNFKNEKLDMKYLHEFFNSSNSSKFSVDSNDVIKLFKSKSEKYVDEMLYKELKNSIKLESIQDDKFRFTPKLKGYINNLNRINKSHFTRSNINYGIVYEDGGINLDMLKQKLINNEIADINFEDFVNILKGLMILHQNNHLHMDIKSLNILYNIKKKKFYLIDFGTLYNYSLKKQELFSDIKKGFNNALFNVEQLMEIIENEIIIQYQHKQIVEDMIDKSNDFKNMKKLDINPLADAMIGLIKELPNNNNIKENLLKFFNDMKNKEEIDDILINKYNKIFNSNNGGKSKRNKSAKKDNNKLAKKDNNKLAKIDNNKLAKKDNNKSTKKYNKKSTKKYK